MRNLSKIIKKIILLDSRLYSLLVIIDLFLFSTILASSLIIFKYILLATGLPLTIGHYQIESNDLLILFALSVIGFFISNLYHLKLINKYILECKENIMGKLSPLQLKMIISIAINIPVLFVITLILLLISFNNLLYLMVSIGAVYGLYRMSKTQNILEKYFLRDAVLPIFSIGKKNDIFYYFFYISNILFLLLQLHYKSVSTSSAIVIFFIIRYLAGKLKEVLIILSFNKLLLNKQNKTTTYNRKQYKGGLNIATNKKSNTLVLLFPPYRCKSFSKNFLETQGFYRHNRITIYDLSKMKTLNGLNDKFPNFSSIISHISNYIHNNGIKNIITFGCSGGGHPALLYGSLLNADVSIAINPFPYLSRKEILKRQDIKTLSTFPGQIKRFDKLPKEIKKYFDLRSLVKKNNNQVRIHISDNSWDILRANYLGDLTNVKIIKHSYKNHGGLLGYLEKLNRKVDWI